jgi:predicted helicase
MNFPEYILDVNKRFITGNAREHAYRPSLQNLLESIIPEILATNDPARIKCGAPDFILTRRMIDVGYIEAKDIGIDLNKTEKDEQIVRYLSSLDNLILTDYLEFRFFVHGQKVSTVRVAEVVDNVVRPLPENFDLLKTLLIDFSAFQGQTIKSAKRLAEMMAQKAKLMRDIFRNALESDEPSSLKDQMKAFKTVLMHDLDAAQFADIYAQTIAYGLFTARLHDTSIETFSRSEALLLIPASNPFLRQLFSYVAGPELDNRVDWIVDALCEVYRATDLKAILKDFGSATGQNDPILHFYETFLGEYDRSLKKARGVWYTPEPVVQFIVRAIDDVLKEHFGLVEGLADISKVQIEVETDRIERGRRAKEKRSVHRVQLLDVATGTGTFLAETIKQIYRRFEGQEGTWSRYVDNDLLPRLHGFELLMASYAMCHMKLDMLLRETGYKPLDSKKPPRVSVYLTNSLEEHHADADTLFASWLSREANEASRIKKDMPIMVAFGNPPYSVSSSNRGEWIQNLIKDYKKGLNEKKLNLDDDYIKFIRYSENYIEKIGYGIVAMITNNSFIDGVTHRQMRRHLLETFDDIYIYDLHGSSNKKETSPDGSIDKNVFDIQQGVCISVFVRNGKNKKGLASVYHFDSYGKREDKYKRLSVDTLSSTPFQKIECKEPNYFFVPKNLEQQEEYNNFFSIDDLFPVSSTGIETKKDALCVAFKKEDMEQRLQDIKSYTKPDFINKYAFDTDGVWDFDKAKKDILSGKYVICDFLYRPLDFRFTALTQISNGFLGRPRYEVMQHMIGNNVALIAPRFFKEQPNYCCTKYVANHKALSAYDKNTIFPLYLQPSSLNALEGRTPNLSPKIFSKIQKAVSDVSAESLFNYIYAILHSKKYLHKYDELLRIGFPRIPYPSNVKSFHALAEKGDALRSLHLMEDQAIGKPGTTYPIDGSHTVNAIRYESGKVWINESQYFGNVPEAAWKSYIGGYQPAQKWLKDRKDHNLTVSDIRHYQKIISVLIETERVMAEIDENWQ